MRELNEIIEQMEINKTIANTVVDSIDHRTYAVKMGKIKRAKENLNELFLEYRDSIKNKSIFILPKGTCVSSFIKIATTTEMGCFSVSADEIYDRIASEVHERYYTDIESSPTLFDIMMAIFNNMCTDLGIVSYPMITFESKYRRRLTNKEDLLQLIKDAFNDKVGVELVGLYAINKVAKQAIDTNYRGKLVPIILHTDDKGLINILEKDLKNFSRNVFALKINAAQSDKTVEEKLVQIRAQIQ
jgi:hypothetical protein